VDTRVVTNQPSIAASSADPRRGASGPTIVLGFASIGGLVGLVGAAVLSVAAITSGGPPEPGESADDMSLFVLFVMLAAGVGWLVGAGIGSTLAEGARAVGVLGRRLVLGGACAVALGVALIVIWPRVVGWPETEVIFFSIWRTTGGPAFAIATMIDGAIAVMTFLGVSKHHGLEGWGRPRRAVGAIGIVGLLVGGLVFAWVVAFVLSTWSGGMSHDQYLAVHRTTMSLRDAVREHLDRTGSYPANLAEVLAAGGEVQPGAQVEFAGVENGSFCVRVGVDVGMPRADDPHYSTQVNRRPPEARSWTSSRTQSGNSCSFQGPGVSHVTTTCSHPRSRSCPG